MSTHRKPPEPAPQDREGSAARLGPSGKALPHGVQSPGSLSRGAKIRYALAAACAIAALLIVVGRDDGASLETATGLDMRLLKTPITGHFWDLRSFGVIEDQPTRRELGKALPAGAAGILFCASERPSGTALCVLDGECLGRSLQTTHYRFVWDGAKICLLYAFDNEGTEIDPRRLSGESDILAA